MDSSKRQTLLKLSALAVAAPFATRILIEDAHAALPRLPEDHPLAKALAYVKVASQSQHPRYRPGQYCDNCRLYTAATGACTVTPGFSVEAKGWCLAWVPMT